MYTITISKADGGYIINIEKEREIIKRGIVPIMNIDEIPKFRIAPLLGAYILELAQFEDGKDKDTVIKITD